MIEWRVRTRARGSALRLRNHAGGRGAPRVGTNHDKLLAAAEVLHRGGPAPAGTPPDRFKQQYWLAAHPSYQPPSCEPVDEGM